MENKVYSLLSMVSKKLKSFNSINPVEFYEILSKNRQHFFVSATSLNNYIKEISNSKGEESYNIEKIRSILPELRKWYDKQNNYNGEDFLNIANRPELKYTKQEPNPWKLEDLINSGIIKESSKLPHFHDNYRDAILHEIEQILIILEDIFITKELVNNNSTEDGVYQNVDFIRLILLIVKSGVEQRTQTDLAREKGESFLSYFRSHYTNHRDISKWNDSQKGRVENLINDRYQQNNIREKLISILYEDGKYS